MAKLNPYRNTGGSLQKKNALQAQRFLNANIKNAELNITIGEIIEMSKYVAFEEGRRQGNYESAQALKALIDVENPELEDTTED
jgi:hypothetical protein